MTAETVAALIWRFLGLILFASVVPSFVRLVAAPGAITLAPVYAVVVMAMGVALIVFSKRLGAFMAAGL